MSMSGLDELVRNLLSETMESLSEQSVQTFANKGDVAEGVLGAAIVASFLSPMQPATYADLLSVLGELDQNQDESKSPKVVIKSKTFEAPKKSSRSKTDKVHFTLGLSLNNYRGLHDRNFLGKMRGIVDGALKFANSPNVKAYAQQVYEDPKSNSIEIRSVGTEDQKGTKVDLRIIVDGKLIPWGALSLKAGGTKQLGQVGKGFEATDEDLAAKKSRGVVNMFRSMFGISINPKLRNMYEDALASGDRQTLNDALDTLYYDAYKKITQRFEGGQDELVDLLKTLSRGISKEALLDENEVVLVHLANGDFKALNFNKLVQLMDDENVEVEIEVEFKPSTDIKAAPYLFVWMKVDGQDYGKLISIRPKVRIANGKLVEFRHYIQKESGLINLIKAV